MNLNIAQLEKWVAIVLGVGLIGFNLYLAYVVFFTGPTPDATPALSSVNTSILPAKIQKAAVVLTDSKQKIALKKSDYAFMETPLYQSFKDTPISVPLSESRGRPDPFIPYVAP